VVLLQIASLETNGAVVLHPPEKNGATALHPLETNDVAALHPPEAFDVAAGVASSHPVGEGECGFSSVRLVGEVWSAVKAGRVEVLWWLAGSWFGACLGETAGESCAPTVAGGVDGGAYVRCILVGGVDVAAPTLLFLARSRGNSRSGHPDRTMVSLLSVMFSLGGHRLGGGFG
jgi:hypothetical protein